MKVNISEFAKRAKVSRQTISKQCKAGSLAKMPNGLIDTTHIINAEYLRKKSEENYEIEPETSSEIKPEKQSRKPEPKKTGKKKPAAVKSKKKEPAVRPNQNNHTGSFDNSPLDMDGDLNVQSKYDLDRLKLIGTIEKTRLETEIKRDHLVDKDISRTVFARIYEIHMNQFLTIKDKLTPDIAAIFNISDQEKTIEAGTKIDEMLWKCLDNIKLEINKYLNGLKAEELE